MSKTILKENQENFIKKGFQGKTLVSFSLDISVINELRKMKINRSALVNSLLERWINENFYSDRKKVNV